MKSLLGLVIFTHRYLCLFPPYAWTIGLLVRKISDIFDTYR
jgi:hypothetical protein